MNKGFIKLWRKSWENPFSPEESNRKFTKFEAMLWLISKAAGKDGFRGNGVTLKRGEFSYKVRYLAQKWGWSTGSISIFLKALKTEQVIEQVSEQPQIVYRIQKYEFYNPTNEQVSEQVSEHIKKEVIKKEIIKNYRSEEFEEIVNTCQVRGRDLICSVPTAKDLISEYSLDVLKRAAADACDWMNEKAIEHPTKKTFTGPLRSQRLKKFLEGRPKKTPDDQFEYLN